MQICQTNFGPHPKYIRRNSAPIPDWNAGHVDMAFLIFIIHQQYKVNQMQLNFD